MPTALPTTLLCLAALLATTQSTAAQLTVHVQGIEQPGGTLSLMVVDSAAAYDGNGKPVAAERIQPTGAAHRFGFELPPGRYAVQVMHDENGNGKLDKNVLGIPKEAYGFSNNPRVMRRPHFDEIVFELGGEDRAVTVELN